MSIDTTTLAAEIARAIDHDEPLDRFEDVFPWTVSEPWGQLQIRVALNAWQGVGESRKVGEGYAYLLNLEGSWWTVSVSENMGIESIDQHWTEELARDFFNVLAPEPEIICGSCGYECSEEHAESEGWECPDCDQPLSGWASEMVRDAKRLEASLLAARKDAELLSALIAGGHIDPETVEEVRRSLASETAPA